MINFSSKDHLYVTVSGLL